MNVNLSSRQLVPLQFIASLDRILAATKVQANCLHLELTETSHIPLNQNTLSLLQELQLREIQLSLDDFGTGYSSLAYLQCLPAKSLKIDRSFIRCLDSDWKSRAIVQSLVQLAHSLGMSVTAEGIETHEHLTCVQELGCEYGQGYWFSKPLNQQAMAQLLWQMSGLAYA
jgi:EAL domain-containing protein (putative c-di-GMP-specific phosphodiesterase class I)